MDEKTRALVTGAGSGLGEATAIKLASSGYRVVGTVQNDQQADSLQKSMQAHGVHIDIVQMDVCDAEQVAETIRQLVERAGPIEILVHFAGKTLRGFFEDLSMEEIRDVFDVNVFGTMTVVQAILPYMREQRSGRIVLTTSVAGRIGTMSISGYSSSKFAIEGFGECLAQEVAPFGIHVSLLEPGLVRTPNFSEHRNRAKAALSPDSVYYPWFCQHEHIVDNLLAKNRLTLSHVADRVLSILQARKPKLRYMIGRNARIIAALRRYIPGEVFERRYFKLIQRLVVHPKKQITALK